MMVSEKKHIVSVKGQKYDVILHPDTEDGGYWTECPSLSGCASQGDTVEEALGMIKDAIIGHLEVLEENKKSARRPPLTLERIAKSSVALVRSTRPLS